MSAIPDRSPVTPSEAEHQALIRVAHLLECDGLPLVTIAAPDGEAMLVPESAVRALHRAVSHLARGQAIALVPIDRELTTQQAADLLNVSRPHVVRLLDGGAIPFTRIGRHRRLRLDDLLSYREHRDVERRAALRDLTRLSQELGLYDS